MKNSSKTKILYIGLIPPEIGGQSAGGIATHAWQLATQAAKRGYEVYILANTTSSFTKDGVKVISPLQKNKLVKAFIGLKYYFLTKRDKLRDLNFLDFTDKLSILYSASYFKDIIEKIKPDLIHVHSLHTTATLSLKLLGSSIPLVVTDHGFWQGVEEERDLLKVKQTANKADYIICVSEFAEEQQRKFSVGSQKRRKIIHNPVDVNRIPLLNQEEIKQELGLKNKKVIFFSGVVEPVKRKGLDILLNAIVINQYLRKSKLIIISNAEGINYAKKFMEGQKIDALILPLQSWDRVVKIYNAADVFVMPSKSESFGIVYEESLLVGTPVVGFYPILNALEHLLGIYIGEKFDTRRENERDLAEKIIKVLNTNFDRELMRKKVIEKISWDAKFGEFESVYREALAG